MTISDEELDMFEELESNDITGYFNLILLS